MITRPLSVTFVRGKEIINEPTEQCQRRKPVRCRWKCGGRAKPTEPAAPVVKPGEPVPVVCPVHCHCGRGASRFVNILGAGRVWVLVLALTLFLQCAAALASSAGYPNVWFPRGTSDFPRLLRESVLVCVFSIVASFYIIMAIDWFCWRKRDEDGGSIDLDPNE